MKEVFLSLRLLPNVAAPLVNSIQGSFKIKLIFIIYLFIYFNVDC